MFLQGGAASNAYGKDDSMVMSQDSKFYDATPFDFEEDQNQVLDDFDVDKQTRIPGFSFKGRRDTVLIGMEQNRESQDVLPSVYEPSKQKKAPTKRPMTMRLPSKLDSHRS